MKRSGRDNDLKKENLVKKEIKTQKVSPIPLNVLFFSICLCIMLILVFWESPTTAITCGLRDALRFSAYKCSPYYENDNTLRLSNANGPSKMQETFFRLCSRPTFKSLSLLWFYVAPLWKLSTLRSYPSTFYRLTIHVNKARSGRDKMKLKWQKLISFSWGLTVTYYELAPL